MLSPIDSFLVFLKKLAIVIILTMAGMDASALSQRSLIRINNGSAGNHNSGNPAKIAQLVPASAQNVVEGNMPATEVSRQ